MTSDVPNLDILVANLARQAEVLIASAEMNVPSEPVEIDTPVRGMLQRAGELQRAAAMLGKQRNSVSLSVLSRAILENLILLLWVQVEPKNAADMKETAHAEFVRIARINFEKGKARIMNRSTGEDATSEFLNPDRFQNLKRPYQC